jgi:hypothetical protein
MTDVDMIPYNLVSYTVKAAHIVITRTTIQIITTNFVL